MDKLKSIKPWIIRDQEKPLEEGEYLQMPTELARYKQFIMCINCISVTQVARFTAATKGFWDQRRLL